MNARLGREAAFALESFDDPVFDRRLVLRERPRRRWIVLSYRDDDPPARPMRPMIRFALRGGGSEVAVLPGIVLDAAIWLGRLPEAWDAILLAAGPGFVLERVGLRGEASLLRECAVRRPLRLAPALYQRLLGDGRRYRDILRGACAVSPLADYAAWSAPRRRSGLEPAGAGTTMSVRLVLNADGADRADLLRTLASLRAQTHRAWTLLLLGGGDDRLRDDPDGRVRRASRNEAATAAALLGEAGALGLLEPGDQLHPQALAMLAGRLAGADRPDLVYADDESAGLAPRLKPDWSPDLARVTGYHGRLSLYARALVVRLGARPVGGGDGRDLALAMTLAVGRAAHLPRVLCRMREAGPGPAPVERARALDRLLTDAGSPARCVIGKDGPDLRWPLPEPAPLVSVVIPSKDRLDLIGRVCRDVLAGTDYPAIELVVVDNGSTDPGVLALYARLRADPRVRIEPYPAPFNFSAMVNAGARAAAGSVLLLLNNDVAVREPGWLAALVAQAVRPEVGAVGAKLLYADGRLQHAGVVVGLGGRAGHILRRRPGDAPGHLGRMRVAHEVSAVTAACLAVERAKYEAVGGFDEREFAIDFNDVDFCLRLGARGWKTVWTPRAELFHLESVSRGPAVGAARERFEREAARFAARWADTIRHDPYYHPGLSLTTFGEDLE